MENSLDVDVSRKEIEQFLLKQKVGLIVCKMTGNVLKDLADFKEVDKDFKDIIKQVFKETICVSDKSVVQKITELYNLAKQ